MRPTMNHARAAETGGVGAAVPPSTSSLERQDQGAMMPGRALSPETTEVLQVPPSLWERLKAFRRRLLGSSRPDGHSTALVPALEEAPSMTTRSKLLRVGVVSTVGNYREHNEDNFYLPTLAGKPVGGGVGHREAGMEIAIEEGSVYTFVVADGMGGQLAGEKASQMAVDIIPKELTRRIGSAESDDRQIQRIIKDAVAAANQEILGLSVIQTEFNNMGTTVVLALFRNDRVYVAGIGDSRAYRFRDGRIEQLTKDHSLAQALLEAGTITAEELPNHKFNHVLYLYLGSKDARGGPEDVKAAEFRAGDRFLLASDGLTGVVPDAQLAEVVCGSDDPGASARTLIKLALDNNSKDNVTCLVVHAV